MKLHISRQIFEKLSVKFHQIRPVRAEMFHADRRTDGQTWWIQQSLSQFWQRPLNGPPNFIYITMFNTQNVMETRLAKLYYFEAAEFENDIEIFSLALVFELQLWPEISLFFQLNFRYPSSKVGKTLSGRRNSHTTTKSRDRLSSLQVFVTWSVKLLPVNSLQFLLSVAWKRLYCRWCPQVLLWELFRDSCSCHSTVQYIYKNVPKVRK